MFGAIEAGGTKFVCGIGTGPEDLEEVQFATRLPEETMGEVLAFFREREPVAAVGIGSFGPVDLRAESPKFGHITSTPKAAWRNYNLAGTVSAGLGVPVAFDTDVNAAALGEWRWGAGRGLANFLYVTVGSGIGGGAIVDGRLVHGSAHPEMGHIRIPQDLTRDPFRGCCPYHGNCLEGLAAGPAIQARWGMQGEFLPANHPAWALEAHYLALAIHSWVCILSPQRVLLGGGVMRQTLLFGLIREEVTRLLNGYADVPEIGPPELGPRAGVLGALELAARRRFSISK